MIRLKKLIELVRFLGDGCHVTSFYSEGYSANEIKRLADQFPYTVYVSRDGGVYADKARIAYWKHHDGILLTESEEEVFAEVYGH